jgi:hypothetical protein
VGVDPDELRVHAVTTPCLTLDRLFEAITAHKLRTGSRPTQLELDGEDVHTLLASMAEAGGLSVEWVPPEDAHEGSFLGMTVHVVPYGHGWSVL